MKIDDAYARCAEITRHEAKNFAYGIRLLPPPKRAAMSLLRPPSAAASTILQRNANACALVWRRAQRCSVSRSSSVSATAAVGRPRSAIAASIVVADDEIRDPEPILLRTTDSGH